MVNHKGKRILILGLLSYSLTACGISGKFLDNQKSTLKQVSNVTVHYTMPVAGEAQVMLEEAEGRVAKKGSITIATIGSPSTEILQEAQKLLEKKGYELQIQLCENYGEPNEKVLTGEADGNFFQHSAYLERYNLEKETLLTETVMVYFQPMGVYSGKENNWKNKKENMKILVPESVTGYARALFLLQQEGLITLAQDADFMAVEGDITENPYQIILEPLPEEQIWEKRQEADYIICSTAYVLNEGKHPGKEALAMEKEDSKAAVSFGQGLVSLEEKRQKLQPLAEVLCSKEMKAFITSYYQGSLQFQGNILMEEEESE